MLVRIHPRDAQLGMFVHALEGRWADQPFWQSQCLLDDDEQLDRLRKSIIDSVIIDTDKGRSAARTTRAASPPKDTVAGLRVGKHATHDMKGLLRTVTRARREVVKIVEDVRLGRPIAVARLAPMLNDLSEQVKRDSIAFFGILRLKAQDEYTYLHSIAVSALMMNLARTLKLPESDLHGLGMAGLLHDVGKIAMPSDILNKEGPLTAVEFAEMKRHPRAGAEVLRAGDGVPAIALDVCLHHHERMDGTGYPCALPGAQLSLAARMGAICDVYDALTSDRPYKRAWSPQRALAEMASWQGHFDPALMRAFINSLGIFPVGTLVKLRDSLLGIVVADNDAAPTLPTVRCFYSVPSRSRVYPEDVKLAHDHILTAENPTDWPLGDWQKLREELLVA
jgi:putative nucleotidyltransferase with HDIG domain